MLYVFERENELPLPQKVLAILTARDAVQAALTETIAPASSLIQLAELDHCLQQHRQTIAQIPQLADWRKLLNPPETSWWWFVEVAAPQSWAERLDWIWDAGTLVSLTLLAGLFLNTASRVFVGGAEAWGAIAVVAQGMVTLLTGGALTKTGREAIDRTFARAGVPKRYWQEARFGLSLLALVVTYSLNANLPRFAAAVNQQGYENYRAGRLDSALSSYQQAVSLRPDYAEAHYNLGVLYEDLQKLDLAIAEYHLVVQGDLDTNPNALERLILLRAHNNLGRLYLLKGEHRSAWVPLERGLSLVDADAARNNPEIQYEHYKLLKNLGWVRLQQQYYLEAATWLEEAIELQPQIEALLKQASG